jgi:LDH2 family malate/lactate/ureidoglycolate dehydrogenase
VSGLGAAPIARQEGSLVAVVLRTEELKEIYAGVIRAFGGTQEEAQAFADFFVIADLRGMEWQGFKSLDTHVVYPLQQGIIRLGQEVEVIADAEASFVLEAHAELGQLVCSRAMEMTIERAKRAGSAVGVIRHAGDTGMLAGYTLLALEHDCIGIMFNNTNPYVAPWGGTERMHGIDPLSVAIPAGEVFPILVDMSITAAKPTFDVPSAYVRPFAPPPVLMFETLREYALSVVIEVISGALTAMPMGREKTRRGESAVVCMAIHIPHLISIGDFRQHVDGYVKQVKASGLAEGFPEVLLPGERGFREQEKRVANGVPVDDDVWTALTGVLDEVGVEWRRSI